MKTDIEYKNNILYVKAPCVLVGNKTNKFESLVIPLILNLNAKYVTIGLKDVDLIDKKGVNSLIKMSTIVNKNKGKLVLCELNEYVKQYFKNTDIFDYCFKSKDFKSSVEVFKI